MSSEIYNNIKNLRSKINYNNNNTNFIINYEDNILLNEKLKNFLNINKEYESIKNIYVYFNDYIKKNNLLDLDNNTININIELEKLFNINKTEKLTLIKFGIYINKLLLN